MTKKIYSYNLFLLLLFSGVTHAQKLDDYINTISSALETVEASKLEYAQDLKLTTTNYLDYRLTKVDTKGKSDENVYSFSFSDIDINTVRTITKKDVILIQLLIKGKQKLVKKNSNNGDKVSYVDNLAFYAKNIDNGRVLVDAIKKIIPVNETLEKNKLALTSYSDHINWLQKNIQDVEATKTQFAQKIETNSSSNGHLKLSTTINSKSKATNYEYEFNLATLNLNSLSFKINSDEFSIEASNRRNIKAFKVFKDGVQQSYANKIRFYSTSIENAKDIYKVLKQTIPLAEKAFLQSKPNISSNQNATKYLNTVIKSVSTNDNTYTQIIDGDCVSKIVVKKANLKETIENIFQFNFSDINIDNIDYNSNKNQLYLEVNTRKKAKFIRYTKNNELQSYTDAFKIYVNNIEEAMISKEALQNIVKNCDANKPKTNFSSISSALETLQKEITLVKIGDNNYDQSLEVVSTSPYVIKITSVFSNLKSSKETIYEFGMGDINPKNISITTSGKQVMVELNTKHLEKIIKTYQDGNIKSYAYKIAIQATDVENARHIVNTLKFITQKLEQ
jgi:hypothetical protein